MRTWISCTLAALIWAAQPAAGFADESWNDDSLYNEDLHDAYMAKVKAALGKFDDVPVWEWGPNAEGNHDQWNLINGEYVPVTVNGKPPESYYVDIRSDRPMMLPTRVEGFHGGDGQSNPYNVVGRMKGENPEVQWVFMVRKYYQKEPTEKENFIKSGDVAIIGHHPRTGASTYFQFYDPENPKPVQTVISPFSKEGGMKFWSPLVTQAETFQCQRCHNADPFLHTPWVDQVRVSKPKDGEVFPDPMVPSNPLGPFFFIDSDQSEMFAFWDDSLRHLDNPENKCTTCHRVTPFDMAGLYQNSTRFAGVSPEDHNEFAVEMHGFQTDALTKLPWMPPVVLGDFYAGQEAAQSLWIELYLESATEVNTLKPEYSRKLKKVPRPPKQYESILVKRPNHDELKPGQSILIVDNRMRANTDARLAKWQFYANAEASDAIEARPVVLRADPTGTGAAQYKVVYVGDPYTKEHANRMVSFNINREFDLKLGDYLGLVMTNTSAKLTNGLVPYSIDDWAKISWPDGTPRFPDSIVTHFQRMKELPQAGKTYTFDETDYRTYSFEMRNRM